MDNPNKIKESMLIEVSDEHLTLQLADGSQWNVAPGDLPTIVTWIPTATIRIRYVERNSPWPYELLNTENDVSVRAKRISPRTARAKKKREAR